MAIDPMREPAGITITASQIDSTQFTVWSWAAFGTWRKDGDGAQTNGGGIVGDILESVGDVTKVYDHGSTTFALLNASSALTDWTNNNQLSADQASEEAGTDLDGQTDGDAAYFGETIPFVEIAFDFTTSGAVGVMDAKVWRWEYYNGTQWNQIPTASFFDNTDNVSQDGEESFSRDGAVSFVPPSDWAQVAVDGTTRYWIRARVVAEQISTTPVLSDDEHIVVAALTSFECPHDGTITDGRVTDGTTGTLHTTDDVKFIVWNVNTGDATGVGTWPQDARSASVPSPLSVNRGDLLGVLVTQEDSNNDDPENCMLELQVTRT